MVLQGKLNIFKSLAKLIEIAGQGFFVFALEDKRSKDCFECDKLSKRKTVAC